MAARPASPRAIYGSWGPGGSLARGLAAFCYRFFFQAEDGIR
eukprot:COSAG02_NODE_27580_length_606_cov_1.372781_1_plen_41_part_01